MGLFSALFGSKDLLKANKDQQATVEAAKKESLGYGQPYYTAGTNALKYFQDASGVGNSDAAIAAFQNSPEYKLNYDAAIKAGTEGVQNTAQAGGMYNSGATLKALQDRAQQTSNDFYGNYVRRLGGLSDVGQNAGNTQAQITTNAGNNRSTLQGEKGQIQAAKWQGLDSAIGSGLKLLGGFV
jgi:hypothetical protein